MNRLKILGQKLLKILWHSLGILPYIGIGFWLTAIWQAKAFLPADLPTGIEGWLFQPVSGSMLLVYFSYLGAGLLWWWFCKVFQYTVFMRPDP